MWETKEKASIRQADDLPASTAFVFTFDYLRHFGLKR